MEPIDSKFLDRVDEYCEEEWREVHNGIFAVSSIGRVRRLCAPNGRSRPRLMKASPDTNGYPKVCLSVDGKNHYHSVHVLVMLAFRGPCPDGMEVAHLNGIKADCRLENLTYVTHSENEMHKHSHGTMRVGERNGFHKLTEQAVRDIKRRFAEGDSLTRVARDFNLALSTTAKIRDGEAWKHVQ